MDINEHDGKTMLCIGTTVGLGIGFCLGYLFKSRIPPKSVSQVTENVFSDGYFSNVKCVLVVRMDLKMGKGKIAAQCGHSIAMMMKKGSKHIPSIMKSWEMQGQPKIVLKIDDEDLFDTVIKNAKNKNILTNVVHDAGRTQIAAGSKTVCCIGPGETSAIDSVTGHLKLL